MHITNRYEKDIMRGPRAPKRPYSSLEIREKWERFCQNRNLSKELVSHRASGHVYFATKGSEKERRVIAGESVTGDSLSYHESMFDQADQKFGRIDDKAVGPVFRGLVDEFTRRVNNMEEVVPRTKEELDMFILIHSILYRPSHRSKPKRVFGEKNDLKNRSKKSETPVETE